MVNKSFGQIAVLLTIIIMLVSTSARAAYAEYVPLATSYTLKGHLGVTASGVAAGGFLIPQGTFTIVGIPPGSTVIKALLYIPDLLWDGYAITSATLSGNNLGDGTFLGDAIPPQQQMRTAGWRWDVTSIVTGNGNFPFSTQGIVGTQVSALVVIFSNPQLPAIEVRINDGAAGWVWFYTTQTTSFNDVNPGNGRLIICTGGESNGDPWSYGFNIGFNSATYGPYAWTLGLAASMVDIPVTVNMGTNIASVFVENDITSFVFAVLVSPGAVPKASVEFSQSGVGSDFTGTVLTVDSVNYKASDLPITFTWNQGSSHTYSYASPLDTGTGKKYMWTGTTGLSTQQSDSSFTVSGAGSISASYKTQYLMTVATSGLASSSYPTSIYLDGTQVGTSYDGSPFTKWLDSPYVTGTIGVDGTVSGTAGTQFVFTGWDDSTAANPHDSETLSGGLTLTAEYISTYTVTFTESGLPANTKWSVTLGSTTQSSTTSTITFSNIVAGPYSWSVSSPIPISTGVQYSASTPSGTMTVPSQTSQGVTYVKQYYLTLISSHDSVTGQGWYTAGTKASFSAVTPISGGAGTKYVFSSWCGSGAGSYSGASNPGSVTMNNPITERCNWVTKYLLTVNISPATLSVTNLGVCPKGTLESSSMNTVSYWYCSGSCVRLCAPATITSGGNYYGFSKWSGAASCASFLVGVYMCGPETVTATYTQVQPGQKMANLVIDDTSTVVGKVTYTPQGSGKLLVSISINTGVRLCKLSAIVHDTYLSGKQSNYAVTLTSQGGKYVGSMMVTESKIGLHTFAVDVASGSLETSPYNTFVIVN